MATQRIVHGLISEAKREAEKLHRYRIKSAGSFVILWRYSDGWWVVHHFPTDEPAEQHLFAKLPPIPDTPGDRKRPEAA